MLQFFSSEENCETSDVTDVRFLLTLVPAVLAVFPHGSTVVYVPIQSPPSHSGDIVYVPEQATVPGLFFCFAHVEDINAWLLFRFELCYTQDSFMLTYE